MNITNSNILDIKCILAGVSKKQLAIDLGISQMTLSREIKDRNILISIDIYFENIDPDINIICDKLRGESINEVENYINTSKNQDMNTNKEIELQKKLIELQEKLLKSQEEKLGILEQERKRIIELYGDVYSKQ